MGLGGNLNRNLQLKCHIFFCIFIIANRTFEISNRNVNFFSAELYEKRKTAVEKQRNFGNE